MPTSTQTKNKVRHDWTIVDAQALWDLPFNELLWRAHEQHRSVFDVNQMQVSTLLSIKTGACPEDCKYCPQSTRYDTGLEVEALLAVHEVLDKAEAAKQAGASRFCMGAAWRSPKRKDMPAVLAMVRGVKALGLETCMTLGMLNDEQTAALADAGLDYYNHNLDTSPEYYGEIISTRQYSDRLSTIDRVRAAGMRVCSGGIIGMGEAPSDRLGLLVQLANLPMHPESVPINQLVKVAGTPLEMAEDLDLLDFVRMIALARLMMPNSQVRLSAGREQMSDEQQALCFFAGANSVFYGDCLLTTGNPAIERDRMLFAKLGIHTGKKEPEAHSMRPSVYHDASLVGCQS